MSTNNGSQDHDSSEFGYRAYNRADNGRQEQASRHSRRPHYSRAGRAATAMNGIHRRRNKRWSW